MNSTGWQPIAAGSGSQALPNRRIIEVLAKEIRRLWSSPDPRRGSPGWARLEPAEVAALVRRDPPAAEPAPAFAAAGARRRRAARRRSWQASQPPRRTGTAPAASRSSPPGRWPRRPA